MPVAHIAVVVLTWNNVEYTLNCLHSLAEQEHVHTVYVVDNGSTDGTPDVVRAAFPAVQVIRNDENLGFSAGNNVGLAAAFADGADAVLVLNNDTTLAPRALAQLADAASADPTAGILSPLILFAQPPHRVWFAGARVNAWLGRSTHQQYGDACWSVARTLRPIDRATGCAMLVTRACYARVGGFDGALFMYFEDVEYSLRARNAGYGILLVPEAIVYHHVSTSVGGPKSPNVVYYTTRNAIVVMDRYRPFASPAAALRRVIIALGMIAYVTRPPRALGSLRDIVAGYRDSRCRCLGPRVAAAISSRCGPKAR